MTRLALRATRALQKENGRRLLAREEFLTQDEIAELIDNKTLLPKLVTALEQCLEHLDPQLGNLFGVEKNARAVLAEANRPLTAYD